MAVTIRVRNAANTLIATADIPDATVPRIAAVFGNAQAALDWMLQALRAHVRESQVAAAREAQVSVVETAGATAREGFEIDWPG